MNRKFKKHKKHIRRRRFKNKAKSWVCRIKIFKFIFLIISINFIIFSFDISLNDLFSLYNSSKKEINNYWIKNQTEFINYFLPNLDKKKYTFLNEEISKIQKYFSLKTLLKDENCSLNLETKEMLKNKYLNRHTKNISLVKNIFIKHPYNFGNQIISLNNVIFYCEVLGIKNIFLRAGGDSNKWYIKDDVITDKIKISLLPKEKINCNSEETICVNLYPSLFYPNIIKPKRRSLILKEEILRNLPKIKTNKGDLYIHIRAGDMFSRYGNMYIPIPYCFYQKILSSFKFKNIFLISVDDKSPIIDKLLLDYPKIQHKIRPVQEDISALIYTYNLVVSVSSFALAAIGFNDNLRNLFEYDVYKLEDKIVHFHYDIDKLNRKFNIYRMKPSEYYFNKMYNWRNNEKQRNLLFEENCKYDLIKTRYTKTFFD